MRVFETSFPHFTRHDTTRHDKTRHTHTHTRHVFTVPQQQLYNRSRSAVIVWLVNIIVFATAALGCEQRIIPFRLCVIRAEGRYKAEP